MGNKTNMWNTDRWYSIFSYTITFPAVLALIGFQTPVSVHVFIQRLLPSESFSTFLTHKRAFTCVYPLVTFHITYSHTTYIFEENLLHYYVTAERFNGFFKNIYSSPFVRNLNWQSVHWYFRNPACRCSCSRSWDFCLNDFPHWLHKWARWFRCIAMWDWRMLVCENALRHTEHLQHLM